MNQVDEKGFLLQSQGSSINIPGIGDLQSRAEAFLQSAKLAIRATAQLVEPFYGVEQDHKFHKFAAWAESKFGRDDPLSIAVKQWEPLVKHIVTMRNAVDHPSKKPGGRLVVKNFQVQQTVIGPKLTDPMWGLTDNPMFLIHDEMEVAIERIIELGEEILVCLFYKFRPNFPFVVIEIPKEQRDPNNPKRLRVGLAFEAKDA